MNATEGGKIFSESAFQVKFTWDKIPTQCWPDAIWPHAPSYFCLGLLQLQCTPKLSEHMETGTEISIRKRLKGTEISLLYYIILNHKERSMHFLKTVARLHTPSTE
jgi:hypothetical protein